jgi:amino acid adenylation domain-containing protein
LDESARVRPDATAVEEPGRGRITYEELAALSDRFRDRLRHLGVQHGDRVGICTRKSIDALIAVFGALKAGAAYVPVDPSAPAARNAYILRDCAVRAVVLDEQPRDRAGELASALDGATSFLWLEQVGGGHAARHALERDESRDPAPSTATARPGPGELAYILYTSGSTGHPKGVMLSHTNALSFVDWASEVFAPSSEDRFSSHAPLWFDLSVLDVFLSIKHGSTLVLVAEDVGKQPGRLASLIADERISIWYSTPSILSLLAQYGNLERYDFSPLRLVLFAGEVFPLKNLKLLQTILPEPRYFNLYGPTETNVCTYYEVPARMAGMAIDALPIGSTCSHLRTRIVGEDGGDVPLGEEGELCVSGPAVMQGYWNLPERTAEAFLKDQRAERWYRTGDIVVETDDGHKHFRGRRDRMVKRRGYRVELGEIEAALYRHDGIREVAAIAMSDAEGGVRIEAVMSCVDGQRPSVIELKSYCAAHLPAYMIPDGFAFRDALPKTTTDKIDYQRLRAGE